MVKTETTEKSREELLRKQHEAPERYLERIADGEGTLIRYGGDTIEICQERKYYESADHRTLGIMVILFKGERPDTVRFPQYEADEVFIFTPEVGQFINKADDRIFANPEKFGFMFAVTSYPDKPGTPIIHYIRSGEDLDLAIQNYARHVQQAIQMGQII